MDRMANVIFMLCIYRTIFLLKTYKRRNSQSLQTSRKARGLLAHTKDSPMYDVSLLYASKLPSAKAAFLAIQILTYNVY